VRTFQKAVQLNTRWVLLDGYVGSSRHISYCSRETLYQTVVSVAQLYFYHMCGGGNMRRVKHMHGNNVKGAKKENKHKAVLQCAAFLFRKTTFTFLVDYWIITFKNVREHIW
jgi:hypothetical protein